MKKWTEFEIASIGDWPIQGQFIEDKIRQVIKNQNDIIDWIQTTNIYLYNHKLEIENDSPSNSPR